MSDADKILAEMLEAVPDTYQKTVGFPTWDWLAAASIPIAQTEAELEEARPPPGPANPTGEGPGAYIFPRTGERRGAGTRVVTPIRPSGAVAEASYSAAPPPGAAPQGTVPGFPPPRSGPALPSTRAQAMPFL